jgi:hypothetical protein
MFIRNQDLDFLPIPDQESKTQKEPDHGSATLIWKYPWQIFILRGQTPMICNRLFILDVKLLRGEKLTLQVPIAI